MGGNAPIRIRVRGDRPMPDSSQGQAALLRAARKWVEMASKRQCRIWPVANAGTLAGIDTTIRQLGASSLKQVAAAYLQLLNYLKYLSGAVIVGVFLLIVSDVFVRLVGKQPWLYSSVLAEYGLLWFTMLAAPWLARNKAHVFIDALRQFLSEPLQRIVAKFVYLSCTLVSLVVCYYSFDLLWVAIREGEIDTRAVDMPKWMLLAPIPPCFFLLAIEFGRFLLGFDSMYGSRTDVKEVA